MLLYSGIATPVCILSLLLSERIVWPSEEDRSIGSIVMQSVVMGLVVAMLGTYLYTRRHKKAVPPSETSTPPTDTR